MVSNGITLIPSVEIGASFIEMEGDMCTHRVYNYIINLYFSSGRNINYYFLVYPWVSHFKMLSILV